jgi:septum formation protein
MADFPANPTIVLASNSPRRLELLALGGWSFRIQAADVDESIQEGESAPDYVLRLAETKARTVAQSLHANEVIVAADTTVVDRGQILGKPDNSAQAAAMLRQLRGHTHQVVTAVAVLQAAQGALLSEVCITDVPMREYRDEEIAAYVASGDPLDKAGAYAIQNRDFHPVETLHGCFASVMGLPLCHLTRLLRKTNLKNAQDVPKACQEALDYSCEIYPLVLGKPI